MVEMMVALTGLVFLVIILLPRLAAPRHIRRINCLNNLVEVGIAFRIWEGDNNGQYPMAVPLAQGGARELIAKGDVAGCFQVMSNELSAPKTLICPVDSQHVAATNWNLSANNISYFIGLDATDTKGSHSLLSGDDNLVQHDQPVVSGMLSLAGNQTTWTAERHMLSGNVLVSYGLVQSLGKAGFNIPGGTFNYTNRVVIP